MCVGGSVSLGMDLTLEGFMGNDGVFTLRRVEGDLFIFKPEHVRQLKKIPPEFRLSTEGKKVLLSQVQSLDSCSETDLKRISFKDRTPRNDAEKTETTPLVEDIKKPFEPEFKIKVEEIEEVREGIKPSNSQFIKPLTMEPLKLSENEIKQVQVPPTSKDTTPKNTTRDKGEGNGDTVIIRDLAVDKTKIYIHTPSDDVPGRAYVLARMVFDAVTERDLLSRAKIAKQMKAGLYVSATNQAEGYLNGTWKITMRSQEPSFWEQLKSLLPATRKYEDPNIIHLDITKVDSSIESKVKEGSVYRISEDLQAVFKEKFDPNATLLDRCKTSSFSDPWTWLSARYMQQHETSMRYVSEKQPNSTGRFVLKDGILTIVSQNSKLSKEEQIKFDEMKVDEREKFLKKKRKAATEQNRETFLAYIKYLRTEFGEKWVSRIQPTYGFDLIEMAKQGQPLTPDHVYQINILMSNIHTSYLRHVYKNILLCQQVLKGVDSEKSIELLWKIGGDKDISKYFSVRVLRGICGLISSKEQGDTLPTIKQFKAFLDDFNGGKPVSFIKELNADAYRSLVRLLEPSESHWRAGFTGRLHCDDDETGIAYDSEKAYPTKGNNKDDWDPNSELHDLLEQNRELHKCRIPDLDKKEGWGNGILSKIYIWFLERYAHVISKKTPFWPKANKENKFQLEWSSHALIPAPKDKNGNNQYYDINLFEDGEGLCLYTLTSANENFEFNGKPLPTVFDPRSTAANSKNFGGPKTVTQDAKIEIGTDDDMKKALPYIKRIIDSQSMPFWMGYKTWADQLKAEGKAKEALEQYEVAFAEFRKYLKLQREFHHVDTIERKTFDEGIEKAEFFESMRKNKSQFKKDLELLRKEDKDSNLDNKAQYFKGFLDNAAKRLGVRVEDKKKLDAVFTGHSLGGAHAAQVEYMITNKLGLMPLPGCQWLSCIFDSVKVSEKKNSEFMELMRKHGKMFAAINKDTGIKPFASRIFIQAGDPVSASGEKNLFSGFDEKKDGDWCDFQFSMFDILDTAQHPDITMQIPVHAPRFLSAKEGVDYVWKVLSSKDLQYYEDTYLFSVGDLKQYKIPGPASVELARKVAGVFGMPILEFMEEFDPQIPVPRDSKKVFKPKEECDSLK